MDRGLGREGRERFPSSLSYPPPPPPPPLLTPAAQANSSENVQLSQRNDGPKPARSLQSTTKGKYSRKGICDTTKVNWNVPLHDRINQFPHQLKRINGF